MSVERIPVVYVAGSGHTGSTLLALLLDSHPEIACVGETAVKPKIRRRGDELEHLCSCGAAIAACPFWTRVFAAVRERGRVLGAQQWTNDYRFENPIAQKILTRACTSPVGQVLAARAADVVPFYRSRVAAIDKVNVAFVQAVLEVSGARVFADTSKRLPQLVHLLRVPQLDVKLVLLVRDVRGYAASAKRRGYTVLDAARSWSRDLMAIRAIAARLPAGCVETVRYEDVCEDREATLRRLWAFCGVGEMAAPDVIDAAQHHVLGNAMRMGGQIRIRVDQSWRERLSEQETTGILDIAGDLNRKLGYV